MNEDLVAKLSAFAARMNKIERRLKEAEILREEVVIAGINELRYAGRRFVDAWAIAAKSELTDEDLREIDKHFIIAEQYLENADHDVTDGICYFVHDEMKDFIKKYGINEIDQVSPNFLPFMKKMSEMNKIVSGSREQRKERGAAYDDLESNYIPELIGRYDIIRFSEPLVLARRRRSRVIAGAWGAFVAAAVIFGVITGVVTLLGWDGSNHLPWVGKSTDPEQAKSSNLTAPENRTERNLPLGNQSPATMAPR